MDVVLELVKVLGFPAALVLLMGWYHVRTVKAKDEEIQRLNDARVLEKQQETVRLLKMQAEFTQLQGEQQQTLKLLADRVRFCATGHPLSTTT